MVDRETLQEGKFTYKEPFTLFERWYNEAKARKDILKPGIMCLATIANGEAPTVRVVTLKKWDKDGFVFFTHYRSRKSQDIIRNVNNQNENSYVAATFYWAFFDRSVRIEGTAEKLSSQANEKYYKSIPVAYQLVLSSSRQSEPIASINELYEKKKDLEEKYVKAGSQLPMLDNWGGYIIRPSEIEFYQGQKDGFHHRVCFRRIEDDETTDGVILHEGIDGWIYERLAP